MDSKIIDRAFKEGKEVRKALSEIQGEENSSKTIERFSYRFLEGLRRKDSGDLAHTLIKLYLDLEQRRIPDFFKELLKNVSSMNQIGYAFLLGLNSSERELRKPKESEDMEEVTEVKELIDNEDEEE